MIQLKETVKSLESDKLVPNQRIEIISADVTNFNDINIAIKEIETKNRKIDVLFSCAGI